jgi:cytochrome c biogenesis protein CcmG, thiol:disulfide interchange protein DsbE
MMARLSIVIGLLLGIAVAGLLLGGIYALTPQSQLPVAQPSDQVASASPTSDPSADPSPTPSEGSEPGPSDRSLHIGQAAPPLVVSRVGGGTIDLASLEGKPVWLDFMASWCAPCQDELPLMNDFASRYEETGLVVIAVDVQEAEATVAAFVESVGATFPIGLDPDGMTALEWDAVALPVHYWIDTEGVIRRAALSGAGPDLMVEGLKSILPDVDVTP